MWGPKQEKVRVCTQTLANADWSATGRRQVSLDRAVVIKYDVIGEHVTASH